MLTEHRIARVIWQTEVNDVARVHPLQNQISRFSAEILPALLNEVFEHACSEFDYFQFDQVEIDLGQIPAETLWQELPQRLRQQLQAWLDQSLNKHGSQTQQSGIAKSMPATQRDLASLSWYLRYASYPWWYQQTGASALMQACLKQHASGLRDLLVTIGQQTPVRWRLVQHFFSDLAEILQLLIPNQAEWISDYIGQLQRLQRHYELVSVAQDDFERKLWFVVLTQILCDRGSLFNQASFLRSHLQGLAQQLGCSYAYLMTALWQVLSYIEQRGQSNNRWFTTLSFLQQQEQATNARRISGLDDSVMGQAAEQETALRWAALASSWQSLRRQANAGQRLLTLAELVCWAAQRDSRRLAHVLRSTSNVDASSEFLLANLKKVELPKLLPVLAPDDYAFIQLHLQQHTVMARAENWREDVAWRTVLGYLLSSSASYFNRRQFVSISLHKTAQQHGVSQLWLLGWMIQSLQKLQPIGHRFELLIICRELYQTQRQRSTLAINDNTLLPQSAAAIAYVSDKLETELGLPVGPAQWRAMPQAQQLDYLKRYLALHASTLLDYGTTVTQQIQRCFSVMGKARAHLIWQQQFTQLHPHIEQLLANLNHLASILVLQRQLYRRWRIHYPDISVLKLELSRFALEVGQGRASLRADSGRQFMAEICQVLFAHPIRKLAKPAQQRNTSLALDSHLIGQFAVSPWFAALRPYLRAEDQCSGVTVPLSVQKSRSAGSDLTFGNGARTAASINTAPTFDASVKRANLAQTAAVLHAHWRREQGWHWPEFLAHYPVARYFLSYVGSMNDAQLRRHLKHSPASLAFFELLTQLRMQYRVRSIRYAYTDTSTGKRTAYSRHLRRGANRDGLAPSDVLSHQPKNETDLLRILKLPEFMVHSRARLTQLLHLCAGAGLAGLPGEKDLLILKETCLALALSYRQKTIGEIEFYRHWLRLLQQDYGYDFSTIQQFEKSPLQRQIEQFWSAVVSLPKNVVRYEIPATRKKLFKNRTTHGLPVLPQKFSLPQDYQGAYLRHELSAALIHYWLEHQRFPHALQNAGSWSLARFWQDAIDQGYDFHGLILKHSAFTSEKVKRIASFLTPGQVQKLLVTRSGISREQALALRLWHQHVPKSGLSLMDQHALQNLWQLDLLSAWWRCDNQALNATRLMLRLEEFLRSKSLRQRSAIQAGLGKLSRVLPWHWRQPLLLLLAKTSAQAEPAKLAGKARLIATDRATRCIAPDQRITGQTKKDKQSAASERQCMKELQPIPALSKQETADLSLPILLRNGGLVLLQGFYSALFSRLNYTQNDQFLNPDCQQRAALLLHYLSTGKSRADESELVLNKLLTGMQLTMNLPESIELEQFEVDVCNSLLYSAIDYWNAIGRSTVDGFRGNWLIRNASLSDAGDHWRLIVDRRAYDILLARSPFSYSVVRLPWMSKAIYVTWPT